MKPRILSKRSHIEGCGGCDTAGFQRGVWLLKKDIRGYLGYILVWAIIEALIVS
jgi:hypothetical protein